MSWRLQELTTLSAYSATKHRTGKSVNEQIRTRKRSGRSFISNFNAMLKRKTLKFFCRFCDFVLTYVAKEADI